MTELKISESTKVILDQYKSDIESAEMALNIAKKAANDILNVILFEAHFNPNEIKNLKIMGDHLSFDLKESGENGVDSKEIETAINEIPNA